MRLAKTIQSFLFCILVASSAFAEPFDNLAEFDFGKNGPAMADAWKAVSTAAPAAYPELEKQLLAVLEKPMLTVAAKDGICQMLRIVGSETCVAPVAKLLATPELADPARLVLETIPGKAAEAELLKVYPGASEPVQIGIFNSLAARESEKVIELAGPMLKSAKPEKIEIALKGLSHLGSTKALAVIDSAVLPAPCEGLRELAIVEAATRIAGKGDKKTGVAALSKIYQKGTELPAVIAAFNGLLTTGDAPATLVKPVLKDQRTALALAAAKAVQTVPGPELGQVLGQLLPELQPRIQAAVITAITVRGDKAAFPAIKSQLNSADPEVQLAAIEASGKLGDAAVVPILLEFAGGSGESAEAAQQALGQLNVPALDEQLLSLLSGTEPKKVRPAALALRARGTRAAVPPLLKLLGDGNPELRAIALEVLDGLVTNQETAALLQALNAAPAESQAKVASLLWKAARGTTPDASFVQLWNAAAGSSEEVRAVLLPLAASADGRQSLAVVAKVMAEPSPVLKETAVATLLKWKSVQAVPHLMELVSQTNVPKQRILGARVVVDLLLSKECPWKREQKIEALKKLLPLMERPEDKKMVEEALAKISTP